MNQFRRVLITATSCITVFAICLLSVTSSDTDANFSDLEQAHVSQIQAGTMGAPTISTCNYAALLGIGYVRLRIITSHEISNLKVAIGYSSSTTSTPVYEVEAVANTTNTFVIEIATADILSSLSATLTNIANFNVYLHNQSSLWTSTTAIQPVNGSLLRALLGAPCQ